MKLRSFIQETSVLKLVDVLDLYVFMLDLFAGFIFFFLYKILENQCSVPKIRK